MIDLHFHLLPGVDDGPPSTAAMLELARAAYDAGTRTIVATPHVDEHWGVELADVDEGVRRVRDVLATARIGIDVVTGAEVSLARYLEFSDDERARATIGDSHYVLLETPHGLAAGNFDGAVEGLLAQDHPLVLAHPERCPLFQRRPEQLARLVEAGALCSITAASLRGSFGRTVREFAVSCLESGLVHNVASDAHSVERRGPVLASAFTEGEADLPGLEDSADYFVEEAPTAILAGERPADPPEFARPRRRGLFGRLR